MFANLKENFKNLGQNIVTLLPNVNSIDELNLENLDPDKLVETFISSCTDVEDLYKKLEDELSKKSEDLDQLNLKITESENTEKKLIEEKEELEAKDKETTKENKQLSTFIGDVCQQLGLKKKDDISKKIEAMKKSTSELLNLQILKKDFTKTNKSLRDVLGNNIKSSKDLNSHSLQEYIESSELGVQIMFSEDIEKAKETEKDFEKMTKFLKNLKFYGLAFGSAILNLLNENTPVKDYDQSLKSSLQIYGFKNETDLETIPKLVENNENIIKTSKDHFESLKKEISKLIDQKEKEEIINAQDQKIAALSNLIQNAADEELEKRFNNEVSPARIQQLNLQALEGKTLLFYSVLLKYILYTTRIEFTSFDDIVQKFQKISGVVHHERGILINFANLMKQVSRIDEKLDFEQELVQLSSNEVVKSKIKKQLEDIGNAINDKFLECEDMLNNENNSTGGDEYYEDDSGEQSEENYVDRHNDGSIKYSNYANSRRETAYGRPPQMVNSRYTTSSMKYVR